MPATPLRVPRLRVLQPNRAVVTDWGEVGSLLLRAGDDLVLQDSRPGDLLLLLPRGWGNPMLGRQERGRLIAEPGGVPASPARWSIAGGVVAIERDLERAVAQGQGWHVAVVIRPQPTSTLEQIQAAQARYQGGRMDAEALDALCLDAALAPEVCGVSVAIGAGVTPDQAEALAEDAAPGRVRLAVQHLRAPQDASGTVIVGPWVRSTSPRPQAPAQARPALARANRRPQLQLFGDRLRHGA